MPKARSAATRRALLTLDPLSIFEHTHLQPFLDQTDDPRVAVVAKRAGRDAMLNEPDQPLVADRVEEPRDIGVEDPVHVMPEACGARCLDADRERIQRIVLSASSCRRHALRHGAGTHNSYQSHRSALSRLNTQPTLPLTDASPMPSRT